MVTQAHSEAKHPLSSGMDHALDGESLGGTRQLRRPGDNTSQAQSGANLSPQVKQLQATEAAANTAVIQRKRSNETGLPDSLKAGIETLSGMSMDHVKVVYNSDEPAKVNALAYAEGSEIHVAPGQEQHLPEEAWHLVQQMQGKVKPTTEVEGKPVNDDPALEKEAVEMGAKAADEADGQPSKEDGEDLESAPVYPADAPIQRKVVPHNTTSFEAKTYGEMAHTAACEINELVEGAYQSALQWGALNTSGSPHLANWQEAALAYNQNPAVVPKMIHARFGYAVETLASVKIKEMGEFNGLKASLQESSGHTRPDVVLRKDKKVVAWLDITAEGSKGHIHKKQSSLWKRQPYIAELIYPSLDLGNLLKDGNDPMVKGLSSYLNTKKEIDEDRVDEQTTELGEALTKFGEEKGYDQGGNQSSKKTETVKFLKNDLKMDLGNNQKSSAHGALKYADLSAREFGFYGNDKQSITSARQYVEEKAKPSIHVDYALENLNQFGEIANSLAAYKEHKIAWNYAVGTDQLNSIIRSCLATIKDDLASPTEKDNAQKKLSEIIQSQSDQIEKGFSILHTMPHYASLMESCTSLKEDGLETKGELDVYNGIYYWINDAIDEKAGADAWRRHYFCIKELDNRKEDWEYLLYTFSEEEEIVSDDETESDEESKDIEMVDDEPDAMQIE
jgi:hypothetical protein